MKYKTPFSKRLMLHIEPISQFARKMSDIADAQRHLLDKEQEQEQEQER